MMKNLRFNTICGLLCLGIIAISISACTKDYFNFDNLKEDFITWEPDIAFPVVYSVVDAQDIISLSDSTNIYQFDVDADNFITLIYRQRVFSRKVNDFFQLPQNQVLNNSIALTGAEIGTFTVSGTVQKTLNSSLTFGVTGPAGSQLDKLQFHQGNMNISFTSNFQHGGLLLVSMPELRLNGTPFSQSYPINYQGNTVSVNIDIPLVGYEMDLDNGFGLNVIPINYTLILNQGGGAAPTGANQVQINHSFENMTMAFADGDFGNFNLDIDPVEVDLDVFQTANAGALYFEDPRFRLRITNTIGAEITCNIDDMYASRPGFPNIDINLSSLLPGNQFTISSASAPGDSAVLEYYFTQSNSNIKDIVNGQYEQVYHDFSAEVNPNGPAYNFATRNGAVEVVADMDLPLWGFSDHFIILDTIEVPFDEAADFADNVEKVLLRINTLSHFPVDGLLKLYIADSLYNITDSLLTDGSYIIRSGIVDTEGKVIEAVNSNNDVELDTTRIRNLFNAQYLFIAADITTTDDANRNIRIYLEDNIEIRIGIRVKLKVSPSDLDDF